MSDNKIAVYRIIGCFISFYSKVLLFLEFLYALVFKKKKLKSSQFNFFKNIYKILFTRKTRNTLTFFT